MYNILYILYLSRFRYVIILFHVYATVLAKPVVTNRVSSITIARLLPSRNGGIE